MMPTAYGNCVRRAVTEGGGRGRDGRGRGASRRGGGGVAARRAWHAVAERSVLL